MRTLMILASALVLTLITTRVSAATSGRLISCKIVTGYGTAIGYGKTKLEAKENARLKCGTTLIDQYFAQRRDIPKSAEDDLALACVNKECTR